MVAPTTKGRRAALQKIQAKTFFFGQNDPAFGWEEVVRNGLLVRQLPFYPKCMLVEPFVTILAQELAACIEEAHKG